MKDYIPAYGNKRGGVNDLRLSAIFCTKDRICELKEAIGSTISQTVLPYEIIVVDGGTEGQKIEEMAKELLTGTEIKFIYIHTRPGLTFQRNIGVSKARGDILFFFDDDVVLDKEYFRRILEVYGDKRFENIGGAQGTYTSVLLSPWYVNIYNTTFLLGRTNGCGKISLSGHTAWLWDRIPGKVMKVDFLSGGNMSFKNEVFRHFRFDENFDLHGSMEDVDFSFRVSRRYNLYQVPGAQLFHKGAGSNRPNFREINISLIYNHFLFFRKNMPKTFLHTLAYVWSDIGKFLLVFVKSILHKDMGILGAFITGHIKIVKNFNKVVNLYSL